MILLCSSFLQKENDEEFGKCKRKKLGGQERSETNAEEGRFYI